MAGLFRNWPIRQRKQSFFWTSVEAFLLYSLHQQYSSGSSHLCGIISLSYTQTQSGGVLRNSTSWPGTC
jgi:hypothetical protein